ncbi:uncharacterized protein LOC129616356 isoform X2 [Condylostylus longicornis]|uniref:uncharacterized protein LOC129616356 isoform X2 n=1 Tax=Condylostylus longicornis TaxID=2530218 RepID=UPI00244E0715|nr:uncharacterized protein LOC129616356 isoform X2 [Condylostylus longicornis]
MFVMLPVLSQHTVYERLRVLRTTNIITVLSTALTTDNTSFRLGKVATVNRNGILLKLRIIVQLNQKPSSILSSSILQNGCKNLNTVLITENNVKIYFQTIVLSKNCEKINKIDKTLRDNAIKNVLYRTKYDILNENFSLQIPQGTKVNIFEFVINLDLVIWFGCRDYNNTKINILVYYFNTKTHENCNEFIINFKAVALVESILEVSRYYQDFRCKRNNSDKNNSKIYNHGYNINNIKIKTNIDSNYKDVTCNIICSIRKTIENKYYYKKDIREDIHNSVKKNIFYNNLNKSRYNICGFSNFDKQKNGRYSEILYQSKKKCFHVNCAGFNIKISNKLKNVDYKITKIYCQILKNEHLIIFLKISLNDIRMWKTRQSEKINVQCINNEKLKILKRYKVNDFYFSITKEKKNIKSNRIASDCYFSFYNKIVTTIRNNTQFFLPEKLHYLKNICVKQIEFAVLFNNLKTVRTIIGIYFSKSKISMNPMNNKGLPSDTPDIKAMRYYRLWIYTCNAALLLGVIIFCGAAGKVLMAEYKRLLINDLNLGQPSFIYAYLALLMQSEKYEKKNSTKSRV